MKSSLQIIGDSKFPISIDTINLFDKIIWH